jgi:hypothetical protein
VIKCDCMSTHFANEHSLACATVREPLRLEQQFWMTYHGKPTPEGLDPIEVANVRRALADMLERVLRSPHPTGTK